MLRTTIVRRRAGFTLVELMVSAAVCVLIMAILTQAFVLTTESMRHLKATSELMDQLRAASIVIRDDLVQNHFLAEDGKENKGLRLSDQRLDQPRWTPPTGGFFRVKSSPSRVEGYDNDGLGSYIADGTPGLGHYLHFAAVRPGGRDQDVYSATVNGASFTSPAAEIAIFLDPVPQGQTGGRPYFNLIRRQRLVAMTPLDVGKFPTNDRSVVSMYPTVIPGPPPSVIWTVNTMSNLTDPRNRLGGQGTSLTAGPVANGGDDNLSPSGSRFGDDVLLSHVLSFEVKLLWVPLAGGPRSPRPFANPANPLVRPAGGSDDDATVVNGPGTETPEFPYDSLPVRGTNNPSFNGLHVFDTWTSQLTGWDSTTQNTNAVPLRMRVKAVRVVLRVWDPKLKLSRQMTIVQDL